MSARFSTPLLDSSIERKKQEQEALRLEVIEKLFNALERLSEVIHFEEAYIFGSVARPFRFSKASDIDIGFIGLEDKDFFKAISFISREIGVDVDVVQLEGHRLADKIKRGGIRWTKKG